MEDKTECLYDYQPLSYLWINRFDLLLNNDGEVPQTKKLTMANMRRLLDDHWELEEKNSFIQKFMKGMSAAYLCRGNRLQPVDPNHEQDKKPYIEESRCFSSHILENRCYLRREATMADILSSSRDSVDNQVVIRRLALTNALNMLVNAKSDRSL